MTNLWRFTGGTPEPYAPSAPQGGSVSLGTEIAGVGLEIAQAQFKTMSERVAARETAQYRLAYLGATSAYQAMVDGDPEKKISPIDPDMDGSVYKEHMESQKGKVFEHFTHARAKEAAELDWAANVAAGMEIAKAEGLKRFQVRGDKEALVAIDGFSTVPFDMGNDLRSSEAVSQRIPMIDETVDGAYASQLPSFQTEAQRDSIRWAAKKRLMREYILGAAKDADDPDEIMNANDWVWDYFSIDAPDSQKFSGPELKTIRSEFESWQRQDSAEKASQQRAVEDATELHLYKLLSMDRNAYNKDGTLNENYVPTSVAQRYWENARLQGDVTDPDVYKQGLTAIENRGEVGNREQQEAAHDAILTPLEQGRPEDALSQWRAWAHIFPPATAQSLREKISTALRGEYDDNPALVDALHSIDNIAQIESGTIKSQPGKPEEKEPLLKEVEKSRVRVREQMRRFDEDYPDSTAEQKQKFYDLIRDEHAKKVTKSFFARAWDRLAFANPSVIGAKLREAAGGEPRKKKSTDTWEALMESVTPEEKADIMGQMAMGVTKEQILQRAGNAKD